MVGVILCLQPFLLDGLFVASFLIFIHLLLYQTCWTIMAFVRTYIALASLPGLAGWSFL